MSDAEPSMSLLVVGAGFTGSVLCKILRTTAPQLTLNVWEKSRGIGGRQATKRDGEHSCDTGAQYISHFKDDDAFAPYIKELKSTNVIQKFEGEIEGAPAKYTGDCVHYVASNGMNSTSKYFMSGTNVHKQNKVASLKVLENNQIEVCNEAGRSALFDSVIFTIPAPQLLEIDMGGILAEQARENISQVEFTPRFTAVLVFEETPQFDWTMKYYKDDIISFTVWDNEKRMQGLYPTLLVHSSAPYAVQNTDVKTKEEAGQELVDRIKELYPDLPEPKKVLYHYWRYGQIYKPYPGAPGLLTISEQPLILAGGDSFCATSNMSKCAEAANLLASEIKSKFCVL